MKQAEVVLSNEFLKLLTAFKSSKKFSVGNMQFLLPYVEHETL